MNDCYRGTTADIRPLVLIQNKQLYVVLSAGKFSTLKITFRITRSSLLTFHTIT